MHPDRETRLAAFNAISARYAAIKPAAGTDLGASLSLAAHFREAEQVEIWLRRVGGASQNPPPPLEDQGGTIGEPRRRWDVR